MLYSLVCLQPYTRPNTIFNNGLFPACAYNKSLISIDWKRRDKEIKDIVEFCKANNNSCYDWIVGVSDGKDSTRKVLFVKEKLKMNPLLVCLSPTSQEVSQRGVDNLSNLINHGFDCITIKLGIETWNW